MKIKIPYMITVISAIDLIFGSGGFVTIVLWLGYGIYKLETT